MGPAADTEGWTLIQPERPFAGLDEHELLVRARAGDDDAFGALYTRHRPHATRYALRLLRSIDAADDVTGEAFTRVLRAMRGGAGPVDAFRPYLLIAVHHLAVAAIADRDRIAHGEMADTAIPGPLLDSSVAIQALLADAFARLPDRQRLALWLLEIEGRTVAEVGEILELNANAVSALSFRARQSVRTVVLATLTGSVMGPAPSPSPSRSG